MNKRCLIFLCKKFPYGNGEEFIQQEINFYQDKFDKIFLITSQVNKKDKITKCISPQICNLKIFFKIDISFIICLLKTFLNYSKIMKYEKSNANTIIKKMYLIFFYVKYLIVVDKILKSKIINMAMQYSEIVIFSYWFNDLSLIGIKIKKIIENNKTNNNKCIIISRAHGYDLYKERSIAKYFPFREKILNDIDCVLACSKNGTKYLKENYSAHETKFITNYLGTSIITTQNSNINKYKTMFTIVTCSNIIKLKRLILVARMLKYLENEKNIKNITWICIGEGNQLSHIKKYCSKNLKDIEVIFTGKLKNNDVLKLYNSENIDLFLNVSNYEGLPVSMMEALSYGIPIIATNVGGVSEIVINDLTGQLLNVDFEIYELANIIIQFMNMSINDKNKYKLQCKNIWEQKFNAKINYEKTLNIINKIFNVS